MSTTATIAIRLRIVNRLREQSSDVTPQYLLDSRLLRRLEARPARETQRRCPCDAEDQCLSDDREDGQTIVGRRRRPSAHVRDQRCEPCEQATLQALVQDLENRRRLLLLAHDDPGPSRRLVRRQHVDETI